ncbi:40s ribosomal protein s30 [Nicotiana attenuata]|uniref:40S ribosomal protein S30 n=1 Tax=Nicotiana attenuata TaxID=49451 RepID=A0A1J6IT15_NICAT|nr:40s ribosomal protein s30 [Nicotiana attenuata]
MKSFIMGNKLINEIEAMKIKKSFTLCSSRSEKSTMEKVHGSLARAGKVRGQTPRVAKQDKKKKPRSRAH